VLQCVAVRCSVLHCVAVCCGVLRCVAVCCSVVQCICCENRQCSAACCSVLQCVAVYMLWKCFSVLQCICNLSMSLSFTHTGRYTFSNGSVYVGEFARGRMHGEGQFEFQEVCVRLHRALYMFKKEPYN